jgi:hypothetical protein
MSIEKTVEESWASVERIERGSNKKTKIALQTKYGEYNVELADRVARKLWIGDMLKTGFVLTPSCLTDFIGQQPGPDDVVTMSYQIKYLRIAEGNYIYKRQKPSPEKG